MKPIRHVLDPRKPPGLRWHHYSLLTAAAILGVILLTSVLTAASTVFVVHKLEGGGFKPEPPSGPVFRAGGGPLPQSYSLDKYVVRVHQQYSSESCIGQTGADMEEIWSAERGHRLAFSSGFVWEQVNSGGDNPVSYTAFFNTMAAYGDAPLSAWGYDGWSGSYIYPSSDAFRAAAPYRLASWQYVSVGDPYTIEWAITHGYPLALAMPWHSDLSNAYGQSEGDNGGFFTYWHSVEIIGFDPSGITILNSFGPTWGVNGRIHLSWATVEYSGGSIVMATPALGIAHPAPAKFPEAKWSVYRVRHHQPAIPAKVRGKLRPAASLWWQGHVKTAGGIVSTPQYVHVKHGVSYMTTRFQFQRLYAWIGKPWTRWIRVRAIQ